MTTIVTDATVRILTQQSFEGQARNFGLTAIALLIILLIVHQLIASTSSLASTRHRHRVLDIAIIPLVMVFILIVATRIISFTYPQIL